MEKGKSITEHFGTNLATLLSDRILHEYTDFNKKAYVDEIDKNCAKLGYTQRIMLHALSLRKYLPEDYREALKILVCVLGEENKNETGMFSEYYWILPIGKFVEEFGQDYFEESMDAIEEITKRNTGEYAVRPFIRRYPEKSLERMTQWAKSENFHLRRLASEGLRPKLPWAKKLDTFIDSPYPVFEILEILREDKIMFVKKSVANHLTDWLKVNKPPAVKLIKKWNESDNANTKWIIKRATRKISLD